MEAETRYKALKVILWVIGLSYIVLWGLPTLFPTEGTATAFSVPKPEKTVPALVFSRHMGAAVIGLGLIFLLAARDPRRYLTLVKFCFIAVALHLLSDILNVVFEGFGNLGWFIQGSYIYTAILLVVMAILVPWKEKV